MKIRRNQLCPCGNGKKFKRCHGIQHVTAPVVVASTPISTTGSVYQPLAAHGYAPWQRDEMLRYAQQIRPVRSF
jgi:hypothetical protein